MKARIHYRIGESLDYFDVSGSLEECQAEARAGVAARGGVDAWSEILPDESWWATGQDA